MWIIAGHLTVKAWRARAGRGRTEAPTEDRVGTVTPRSTIRSKIVPWAVAGPSEVGESREPGRTHENVSADQGVCPAPPALAWRSGADELACKQDKDRSQLGPAVKASTWL